MSRHIECRGNTELLLGYSAGQLQDEERAGVERHIDACQGCREFVSAQRAVFEALDGWGAPAVSAAFDRRLQERMREVSWRDRLLARLRPALTWKPLPIAAAAGLVLAAALMLERPPAAVPPPGAAGQQVVQQAVQQAVEPVEPLAADQLESASQDIDMLREWNGLMAPNPGESNL